MLSLTINLLNGLDQVYKSLRVYIDERLAWTEKIDKASQNISSAIGDLKQVRPFVDKETAIIIYNSTYYFYYCDIVWDNLPLTQAIRLQKLQNRAARVINQVGYDIRSHTIREELGWETLVSRRLKQSYHDVQGSEWFGAIISLGIISI